VDLLAIGLGNKPRDVSEFDNARPVFLHLGGSLSLFLGGGKEVRCWLDALWSMPVKKCGHDQTQVCECGHTFFRWEAVNTSHNSRP